MSPQDDYDRRAGSTGAQQPRPVPRGRHAAGVDGPRPLYAGERRFVRSGSSPEVTSSTGATGSTGAVAPQPVRASKSSPYSEGRPISTRNPAQIVAIVAVALIAVGGLGYLAFRIFAPGLFGQVQEQEVETGKVVRLVVPEGAAAAEIGQLLYNNGVIASTSEFSKELHSQGADSSLKSGAYEFTCGQDMGSIVEQLVIGPNDVSGKITIPEGLTVGQTAQAVEQGLGIASADFLNQAKASRYVSEFPFLSGVGEDSLEGYLAPKTFDFSGSSPTADMVIRAMLTQWQAEFGSLDFASSRAGIQSNYNVEMSDYEIIKLASIIEREAVTPDDRPLVSSVFYNRMSQGMALQSDATMMYVTGGEVTSEDLKIESPYNTYLNRGLPPTPICNPSMESVQAALNPADTNFYFFYIVEDGTRSIHDFSETYEEHLEAIDRATQE